MDLKINKLPPGPTKIELDLAENNKPISIFIEKGEHEGPIFGIVSTIHGDEINGLSVIKKLYKNLNVICGTVVMIPILNIHGYLGKTRYYKGKDLNRLFSKRDSKRSKESNRPSKLNKNLKKIIKQFDYLVDLHTASFDNKDTVSEGNLGSFYVRTNMNDKITKNMALLVDPEIILHTLEPKNTLRAEATKLKVSAITIEIGDPLKIQPKYVKRALIGINNMLRSLKITHGSMNKLGASHNLPIICRKAEWMYSDFSGYITVFPELASFVKKGDAVALIKSINGDVLYKSMRDGIVIAKGTDSYIDKGSRIIYIGIE